MRRNDTPEAREFWDGVKATSDRVRTWPYWKRGVGGPSDPKSDAEFAGFQSLAEFRSLCRIAHAEGVEFVGGDLEIRLPGVRGEGYYEIEMWPNLWQAQTLGEAARRAFDHVQRLLDEKRGKR